MKNKYLGIEFGSTRVKAVLTNEKNMPIASGSYSWENKLANGYWSYDLEEVWIGLQESYSQLANDYKSKFNEDLTKITAMGISAMMHGYLPFDKEGNALTEFRTWRNTTTGEAAEKLTNELKFNIPLRWSISHLYQSILSKEKHVEDIKYLTTLAGYIHWKLTGKFVLGIGDASGMFPVDSTTKDYDHKKVKKFDDLIEENNFSWKLKDILPEVLCAGTESGNLTEEGAKLLDKTGKLKSGIILCPPEGDAGTGMVATNSIAEKTGNISAGTSIFSMVVLEKPLGSVYEEIDMVTTPTGKQVAMVHCNNCTNEINAWVNIFKEVSTMFNGTQNLDEIYTKLFEVALEGDVDCGGLLGYNYLSGEPICGVDDGRLLFIRRPDSQFNLKNFMRMQLYSACASLKIGMNILVKENVKIDNLLGHGGFFKTPKVGQSIMASALNTKVTVMETAGEGGAWGCAVLAAYQYNKLGTLEEFLNTSVFNDKGVTVEPNLNDVDGFNKFLDMYKKGLSIENEAIKAI
ncbi:MAG: xylulokinase [Lachnospirales bacterium]